jgi:hypothetical protein
MQPDPPDTSLPPAKPIFESKTAVAGLLTFLAGAVGKNYPEFGQFLNTHATTILMFLGLFAMVLRKLTRGRVVLWPF